MKKVKKYQILISKDKISKNKTNNKEL